MPPTPRSRSSPSAPAAASTPHATSTDASAAPWSLPAPPSRPGPSGPLSRHRVFHPPLGCALVVAGAALVPGTFGSSLPVFGPFALWLYRRLKDAAVCYRCDTVYREAKPGPRQGDFDLLKHDVLKYGK